MSGLKCLPSGYEDNRFGEAPKSLRVWKDRAMGSDQYPATVSRDAMAEHYAYLAEQQNRPKQPTEHNGLVEDFLRSAGHSMIQTPVNAVVQLADKGLGTNMLPSVQINLLKAPDAAEYGTSNYWAQQSGNAVGMLVPFMLAGKGVKAVTRAGLSEVQLAERLTQRSVLGLTMKEAVLTGAVHDSLLRPVENGDHRPFLVAKGLNGVNGAITMGVMHGVATRFAPNVAAETSKFAQLIKNPYMGGLASGIAAGGVSAHTHAYLHNLKFDSLSNFGQSATTDAKFATWKETKESAFTMGVIGLGFGAAHGLKGQFESGRKNFEWQKSNDIAGDTTNQSGGRDFKVVGGERALSKALETFSRSGEANLTVREHLGAGKGIKRFLGMQEYGPEQSLLVKHNKTGQPIIPENSKLADLIATCYLDPTMAGKSVLGAKAFTEPAPIFMRAGKNRLNFAPEEQTVRVNEANPKKLGSLGPQYDYSKLEFKENQHFTEAEKQKWFDGEWTEAMLGKMKTVGEHLKGSGEDSFYEAFKGSRLAKFKVARYIDRGNDAYVIELAPQEGLKEGGALKIASNYEGGWNDSWGSRPYDAKILLNGKHWELSDPQGKDVLAYVQELVTPEYDDAIWPAFEAKLQKAGVTVRDPGTAGGFQYGMSLKTGKLVLVDYEAVDVNPTLDRLIVGNDSERLEALEREELERESKEPAYDQVNDIETLRGRSEAYAKDSVERILLDEFNAGSDIETASYSVIAWQASKNGGNADWSPAALKAAKSKAQAVYKDAKARHLLQ